MITSIFMYNISSKFDDSFSTQEQTWRIHGMEQELPTAIYFGYLSTNAMNKREDLINLMQSPDDLQLYLLMTVGNKIIRNFQPHLSQF